MTKVYFIGGECPPPTNEKLQIWDDQSLLWNAPTMKNFRFQMTKVFQNAPHEKLQISDDQSLLRNAPPNEKTSDLRWPKFAPPPQWKTSFGRWPKYYSGAPQWKTLDLRWPKFTPRMPTPQWKTSDLRWPKFTEIRITPQMKNFRFQMTKVYFRLPPMGGRFQMTKTLECTPQNEKLQIWDDQSLLKSGIIWGG